LVGKYKPIMNKKAPKKAEAPAIGEPPVPKTEPIEELEKQAGEALNLTYRERKRSNV
jgi:hypothetical protein